MPPLRSWGSMVERACLDIKFEHDTSNDVQFCVGKQKVRYRIRRQDLAKFMPLGANLDKVYHLPKVPVIAFDLFVALCRRGSFPDWTSTIWTCDANNDKQDKKTYLIYLQVLEFAMRLGLTKVCNAVIDHLFGRDIFDLGNLPNVVMGYIYEIYGNEYIGLRKYFVDHFLYKTREWSSQRRSERLTAYMEAGNLSFVTDCHERFHELCEGRRKAVDPAQKGKCYYHHHAKRQACAEGRHLRRLKKEQRRAIKWE